jgi:hypothetical protein
MQSNQTHDASLSQLTLHTITTKPWSLPIAAERYAEAGVGGISIWVEALERLTTKMQNVR